MPNCFGLYYPSIMFKDDSWVKCAALYWDKMGRIVPSDYKPDDSTTVRQLTEELGFVVNFEPSAEDLKAVAGIFLDLLNSHGEELKRHYGITSSWERWREGKYHRIPRSSVGQRKIKGDLRFSLIQNGLAVPIRGRGVGQEVGNAVQMHSKLAFIYLSVLAERMASIRSLYPITDEISAYLTVNGYSIDRLLQVLLGKDNSKSHIKSETLKRPYEIETEMAIIALRTVLPQNIANVPVEKIIKLRNQHRDEMTIFQNYVRDLAINMEDLRSINDLTALKAHLETEYEKGLKPQLRDLKKCLKSVGIDTIEGLMNIRVGLPVLLTTSGAYLAQSHAVPIADPVIVGAGAVAFSIIPMLRDERRKVKEAVLSNPAAFLLYTQESLEPANFVSQITRYARRILFSV
jgi:hypothetical protein